ncbi:MAG: hypothetical protein Q8P18_04555 [Pseudomonadota bacterium]|nr:hypothetical protein [Pseudomonadota bacterium]
MPAHRLSLVCSLGALLVGCDATGSSAPTWHADVAPIVVEKCGGCHTAGGIAPFTLDDFAAAAPMADAAVAAVEAGTMPPFDAYETDDCEPPQPWKDDPRLTEAEEDTLRAWAEAGAPEGNPATAARLPEPVEHALEGDDIQALEPGATYTTSGDTDQFVCVSMDPALATDRWLTGLDVLPGNTEVVHHVVVFSDPAGTSAAWGDDYTDCFDISGGQALAVWVPGSPPLEYPEGSAITVTAGARIVMQIHYHAGGRVADPDLTQVLLRWTNDAPEWTAVVTAIGNAASEAEGLLPGANDRAGVEFRIPADRADHVETMSIPIPAETQEFSFFSIATHMHMVGTDMQIRWRRGVPQADEAPEDCLVRTGWDFDWQRTYTYDAPIEELPKGRGGDTLWMQCHYDNTLANPGVQRALADAGLDEPIDVSLGEGSLDEMCVGIVGLVFK